eukprot:368335_1
MTTEVLPVPKTFTDILRCIYGIFIFCILIFGVFIYSLHIPLHLLTAIFKLDWGLTNIKPFYEFYMFTYAAFILEYFCGVKYHIYISPETYHFLNEYKTSNNPGTIILSMNHRTRLDWMWIWMPLIRFDLIQHLTIVSRKYIRFLPVVGWVFCWFGLFLERNWAKDKQNFSSMIKVLGSTIIQPRNIFCFFAEGADLWHKSIAHSNKYAAKSKLPEYKHVLHPRTTGFVQMVAELNENLFGILDGTVAYVDFMKGERMNEVTLLQGRYIKDVCFYFEFYTFDDVIKQFKQKYEKDEFTLQSYLDKPFYVPSSYVTQKERQQFVDMMDHGDKEQREELDHVIADFLKKSFEKKELRLKEWYENGKWMEDDKHKIDYSFIPRSQYVWALGMFVINVIAFVWCWNNMRWYIWLMCVLHTVMSLTDFVGKIVRSYRPWVDQMEKERKEKKK